MQTKTVFRPVAFVGAVLFLAGCLLGAWVLLIMVPAGSQSAHDVQRMASVLAGQQQRMIDDVGVLLKSLGADPAVVTGDRVACDAALRRAQRRNPELLNVVKAGRAGETLCGAADLAKTTENAGASFFREAIERKALVMSPARIGAVPGREQMTLMLPVFDERTGNLAFVLRSDLDLEWLRQRLQAITIPDGMSVTLTDRVGTVIASDPDDKQVGRRFVDFGRLGGGLSGLSGDDRDILGFARFGPAGNAGAVIASLAAPPTCDALLLVALALLVTGVLAMVSERARHPLRTAAFGRLVIVAAVVLAGVGGIALVILRDRADTERSWVGHTYAVIDRLHRVRAAIVDAETGARGFLLTENAFYLTPYFSGIRKIGEVLGQLRALTADNSLQRNLIRELASRLDAKSALLRDEVDQVRGGRTSEAVAILRKGEGLALMDQIRLLIDRMEFEEQALLVDRQGRDSATSMRISLLAAGALGAGFLALLFAAFSSQRDRRARAAREADIREVNRRLLLAEDVGGLGHWRMTLPDKRVTWSDGIYRLHQLDKATFQPAVEATIALCHEDDRSLAREVLAKAIETGEPFAYERRMVRADGSVGWLSVRGRPERDANGAVHEILGVYQDITALTETERRLREQEARYRQLAETTSDMIVMGYVGERRSFFSPAVTTMLGYTVGQALDLRMNELLHPDDLPRVFAAIKELRSERSRTTVTCRLRRVDDTYVWGEAALRYISEPGSKPMLLASIRDVTERRKVEEDLRLAKEAAEGARAQAEKANQAKTEFVAAMSHEIRTPLNAIIGFADLLTISGRLPPDLQRHSELVRSCGLSLLSLVNDILDFSKVEAGAIELERRAFAPLALLDNCLSMVRGSAVSKGLELQAVVDDALPRGLIGDEARLRQVLVNLLNNAVKFTHAGSVALTARHEGTSPRGEQLRFSVRDTGIGIAKAKQHRLFQRFSQVDGSIAREFGGTGLGLAICKQLVELMGGEIGVYSEEGRGATFWFTVTLPRGVLEPVLVTDSDVPARRRGSLLLVEDVPINQELGRLVLEAAGHKVTVAEDGASAVAAVEREAFDLVLMDVQMPGMDGLTATRLIRGLPGPMRKVPIIAMTANVLPEQIRGFAEAGMNDHVAKPFDRGQLAATIDRWLEDAALRSSITQALSEEKVFDRETFDALVDVLGPARMRPLLVELQDQLAGRLVGDETGLADHRRHKRDAHVLVSAGGMLGFQALSNACRALDVLPLEEKDAFARQLATARAAKAAALAEIGRLLAVDPTLAQAVPLQQGPPSAAA